MSNFITNMQSAESILGTQPNTPRALIQLWIDEQGGADSVSEFLSSYKVSNVNTNAEVSEANLDTPLADGQTLSIYTKEVATGGVKGAY